MKADSWRDEVKILQFGEGNFLPRFTLVGATTRIGLIAAPLRARFGLVPPHAYATKPVVKMQTVDCPGRD